VLSDSRVERQPSVSARRQDVSGVGGRGPSLQVLSTVPLTCDSRLHPSDRAFVTSNKPGAAAGSGEVRLGELNP